MTITHRASLTVTNNGTDVTFVLPTGTVEGDICWCSIGVDGNGSPVTPESGWIAHVNRDYQGVDQLMGLHIYYKEITGSEPADYTFAVSSGVFKVAVDSFYDTVGGGTWTVDTAATNEAAPTNACSVGPITSTTNGMRFAAWSSDSDDTVSSEPSGMTKISANITAGSTAINTYYEFVSSGGSDSRSLTYTTDATIGALLQMTYSGGGGGGLSIPIAQYHLQNH